jgi:hypothetical protein
MLFLGTLKVSSQSITRSVISVSGVSSLENNGMISFTAGETIAGSFLSPTNSLTQGFQQPHLFSVGPEKLSINSVEAFPNPVFRDLTLLFNFKTPRLLHLVIYTASSSIVTSMDYDALESGSVIINMGDFPCGFYLLHVFSDDKLIDRIFKIEKF